MADLPAATTDCIERALTDLEARIGFCRHLQMELLTELDRRQVPLSDGARNLAEWAAARLDLAPDTATRLTQTARRLIDQPRLADELASGEMSFDRVVEESRLVASGADPGLVDRSRGWDLTGVRRITSRHQRITPVDEQQAFDERFLAIQPSLDRAGYRLWGRLPGMEGRLVEGALLKQADRFPSAPDQQPCPREQRNADALVAIAQDSLVGSSVAEPSGQPLVSIFVDAHLAAATRGEAGADIDVGPRVGPLTLEQILCGGAVEILTSPPEGTPMTIGPTSRTIPPKLRRFILHRDGGQCTADGCRSRYRLQPHHIIPRSRGGSHDPSNLTTLCWYHHHVVVHRNGYRIDPASPPARRRFLQPDGRSPP